jgi:exopolyphosphatase / guanosine-5'-triphosphate,3'-diphosphate pyrophosphatase
LTTPLVPTACGLDIGSNTFSFTEIRRVGGRVDFVADASIGVRLSEGLVPGGDLTPAAVARGLETLETMASEHDLRNKQVRAVGTAVLRRTGNPRPFVEPAESIIGHPIEIIDGDEEARLTCRGATEGLSDETPWIILDIGGQSTEFSWEAADGRRRTISLEIGVVALTEQLLDGDPPTPASIAALRAAIRRTLCESLPSAGIEGNLLAVAGTASSLAMLNQSLTKWRRDRIHGFKMSKADLAHWMKVMASVSGLDRQRKYGVRPVRADVFPAGICVIEEALRYFGLDGFTISATGLRLGAALSLL